MEYLKRVIDDQLQDYLDAFGAVNIEGPKWCGKTTTAKQKAASIIELQDTDKRDEYLATALTKASLLLEGERGHCRGIAAESNANSGIIIRKDKTANIG